MKIRFGVKSTFFTQQKRELAYLVILLSTFLHSTHVIGFRSNFRLASRAELRLWNLSKQMRKLERRQT